MPIHKTSLYDASLVLQASDFLDLRGVAATFVGIDVNGQHSAGTKQVAVDGTAGTGFSQGDKVVSGLTGRAVGTVSFSDTNSVKFEKGIKETLADNDTLELAPRFEIVGIMPLGTGTSGNLSTTNIDILIPSTTDYFGTLAPNGEAWGDHDDHVTKFGAGAEIGGILDTGLDLPSGTMFEGRWKKVSVSVGSAIIYLKTATAQTF